MAALPPPAAATEEEIVDSDVWLACAVPLSRLPVVGSQVYYFPHGHAEQCPAPLPAALPTPHLFPCTVTAVRLDADAKTNEVYADISLQPGPHRRDSSSFSSAAADADANPQGVSITSRISYYAKQLTQSDANNGGGFSVPRYCADFIFPKLDFEADPPVQTLLMRDTRGKQWRFRHIYRGTPRRHLLTTGWSKFVNAKLLVAGDTVVFMRRQDGELLIGLRRAPRYPMMTTTQQQQGLQEAQAPLHNARARVPPEDVMEAARLAAEGSPFTVAYYPRLGAGEFVVPRKEVEEALACGWEPGMLVRMQVMEAEDARRTDWASGTVKQLHAHIWRPLEVDWDDSSSSSTNKSRFLNGWQVQLAGYPPLLKRLRLAHTTLGSGEGNDSMAAPPLITPPPAASQEDMAMLLMSPPIPHAADGMQGARHNGPADVLLSSSSSPPMITTQLLFPSPVEDLSAGGGSEILDPEFASPPSNSVNTPSLPAAAVQTKSIQLFGTTITPHSAPDAASEEANNEVPHGVLDENVEQQHAPCMKR